MKHLRQNVVLRAVISSNKKVTRLQVVGPLEVSDQEVAGDDDGGVTQDVQEETENPKVLPSTQEGGVHTISRGGEHTHNQQQDNTTHTHTIVWEFVHHFLQYTQEEAKSGSFQGSRLPVCVCDHCVCSVCRYCACVWVQCVHTVCVCSVCEFSEFI